MKNNLKMKNSLVSAWSFDWLTEMANSSTFIEGIVRGKY